jgi:purine-binding chemotaxis protein CheW
MDKQYLTFYLNDLQYGIEAKLVEEIFPLPELIPIPEPPSDIIGLLNWRGRIVPVMHLDLRLGYPLTACQKSDYVIVIQWEGLQIGMVVHQINELVELGNVLIEAKHTIDEVSDENTTFIAVVTKMDSDIIMLLNPEKLIREPDAVVTLIWEAEIQQEEIENLQTPPNLSSFYDLYCQFATEEERTIFRQRALSLNQAIEDSEDTIKLLSLAVISFDDKFFGLNLELVREFIDISNLTPIPCCPNHIVGNMNLRGEIITLVDIRNVLNLAIAPVRVGSKAVVVECDDIVAGLPVDSVLDVIYINPNDLAQLPTIESFSSEQYLLGTVFFQEKMLNVLDLPKILLEGGLVVSEEI